MERQRSSDRETVRPTAETPEGGGLEQVRGEMADIYQHVDHIMDSIGHIDAQQYLEQNLQTGGQ